MDHELRVSHADRDGAVEMLQTAYSEGRIQSTELDERLGGALSARTRGDLAVALRGIPTRLTSPTVATLTLPAPKVAAEDTAPSGGERVRAMAAHWLGFCTLFVGPAIVAAMARRSPGYVRAHAIEAVNFQLTFLGACVALGMVTAVTLGLGGALFGPLAMVWFALSGIAGLAALVGNRFRYPWTIRLIRS